MTRSPTQIPAAAGPVHRLLPFLAAGPATAPSGTIHSRSVSRENPFLPRDRQRRRCVSLAMVENQARVTFLICGRVTLSFCAYTCHLCQLRPLGVMSNRGEKRRKRGHRRRFAPLAFPALRRPPLKALTRAWILGRSRLQPPMHRLASRGGAWPKGAIGQALFKLVIQPKLSQCGSCLFNLLLRNPSVRGNLDFDG